MKGRDAVVIGGGLGGLATAPPDCRVLKSLRHFPLRRAWGNYHATFASAALANSLMPVALVGFGLCAAALIVVTRPARLKAPFEDGARATARG